MFDLINFILIKIILIFVILQQTEPQNKSIFLDFLRIGIGIFLIYNILFDLHIYILLGIYMYIIFLK